MQRSALGLCLLAMGSSFWISGCGSDDDSGSGGLTGGQLGTGGATLGRGGASGGSASASKGGFTGSGGAIGSGGTKSGGGAVGSGGTKSGGGAAGKGLGGAPFAGTAGIGINTDCTGITAEAGKACEQVNSLCPSKSGEQCFCTGLQRDDPTWFCIDTGGGGFSAGGFSAGGFSFGGFSFGGFSFGGKN